jgi:hypothetical protein
MYSKRLKKLATKENERVIKLTLHGFESERMVRSEVMQMTDRQKVGTNMTRLTVVFPLFSERA